MKEKVIYTAIVGSYDAILQPKAINEDYDYILFSNDINEDNIGVWKIRKIPYSNDDKTRIARYVKTHPEKLLEGYKHSVWMDANVQINSFEFYEKIDSVINNNIVISSMYHNERNCIYEEIAAVIYSGVELEKVAAKWLKKLLSENYPMNNGLFETNVVYRNICDNIIIQLDRVWWEYINSFSRRDQLSFNFVLWKLGVSCPYLFGNMENARNSTLVNYVVHSNAKNREISEHQSKFLRYYRLYTDYSAPSVSRLSKMLKCIYNSHLDKAFLWLFGLYYQIKWNIRKLKI